MKKARKKKTTAKKVKKSAKVKAKKPAKVKAKKPATAKAKKPVKAKPTSAQPQGQISGGLVDKQPQDKEKAAVAQQMFLFVDDAWAQRYFDQNDLHFLEREVFG